MKFNNRTSHPFKTEYDYDTTHRLTDVTYPKQYGMTGEPRKVIEPSYDWHRG